MKDPREEEKYIKSLKLRIYPTNDQKTLSMREWDCPNCNSHHIRDVNAAINLKNYIPTEYREFTTMELENKGRLLATFLVSEEEVVTENCEVSDKTPIDL